MLVSVALSSLPCCRLPKQGVGVGDILAGRFTLSKSEAVKKKVRGENIKTTVFSQNIKNMILGKRRPLERAFKGEQNGINFSFLAPSS